MDYNRKLFVGVIILWIFLILPSYGTTQSNDSDFHKTASEVAEDLTKSNEKLHVVLAIDSSASIYKSNQSSKKEAHTFIDSINKKNDDKRIKLGYVIWNDTITANSKNLSIIESDLNVDSINFEGITCFSIALNESIKLLEQERDSDSKDVIVIISDWKENCYNGTNLSCEKLKKLISGRHIYFYPIQIGDSDNTSDLLGCLNKPLPINYMLPNVQAPNQNGPISSRVRNPFIFDLKSSEISRKDIFTNMTVSKSIISGPYGPRIILKFAAPPVPDIKTSIVIAVDSSGSLGKGGRADYGDNIRKSMSKILDDINETMPLSNVSVVSWDDNIDFAYYPLEINGSLNNHTSTAKLFPISKARQEIKDEEVFVGRQFNYPFPFNYLSGFLQAKYPTKYYNCNETESTNLSVGLDSAREIINRSTQETNDATRKLILLIVGRSEFTPCDQDIINKAQREKCIVHSFGIGVMDDSELKKELEKISGNERNYHYCPGSSIWTSGLVADAVKGALSQYNKGKLSNNITVIDTLYPYLRINNSSIKASINGITITKDKIINKIDKNNTSSPTTLRISFDKNLSIEPSDVIEISFDTSLDLSLPIDITKIQDYPITQIDKKIPASYISYKWLGDGKTYNISLPESRILIN
jgi:hypothetical protein